MRTEKTRNGFVLPQFCRDEVNKVSHREYYTGFYFGNQENGQHYGDSQYIREYEVVGMPVECDDSGKAVFALKNRFFDGEELELIQPGQVPYVFRAENVTDDEGTEARAVQRAADARTLCVPVQGQRVGHFAEGQGTAGIVLIE